MTERMGDEQFDRETRRFLAWQAEDVAGAPSATEMATRISDRAGTAAAGLRVAPRLAWVLLAGLLVIALLGALAIGANQPPPAPLLPLTYEAVLLRVEVVGDSHTVVVVGVNNDGRERQIARLPGAWAAYDIGTDETVYLSPFGAVSQTGLLAVPSDRGDGTAAMHWEIFDLHRPQAEPIAVPGIRQDVDGVARRSDAIWGPGERLAFSWDNDVAGCPDGCLTFVEGRTGATTTVVLQEDVLPYWAADGSGVFVGDEAAPDPRRVLRPDGTMVYVPRDDALPSCRTRDASGAELAIEAHDLSDGSRNYSLVRELPDGRREVLSSGDSPSDACLAPDDSAIVYDRELIDPRSGAKFHLQGRFAGWLEVTP